ncbi:MAG: prepilin peptidase [bacterium]|nr:prepilin peptidase [bacterium]
MIIYGAVGFFTLGTIVGSFLNVVILRFNTGVSLGGRSGCFSCGRKIKWHDLVPIVSFLSLRGRCRSCKSRLSLQYPTVELLTGFLFLATFLKYFSSGFAPEFSIFNFSDLAGSGGAGQFSIDLLVLSLLVVISVYDLKHKIIPDSLVFLFGTLAFARLLFSVEISSLFQFPYLLDLLSGPILALPIAILWLISGGRWIGLGDAKLAIGIGWFLGFSLGISAMVVGFWIGAVVGIFLICVSKLSRIRGVRRLLLNMGAKHLTMKSEIPLAPFLILGLVIVYFSGFDVMGVQKLLAVSF